MVRIDHNTNGVNSCEPLWANPPFQDTHAAVNTPFLNQRNSCHVYQTSANLWWFVQVSVYCTSCQSCCLAHSFVFLFQSSKAAVCLGPPACGNLLLRLGHFEYFSVSIFLGPTWVNNFDPLSHDYPMIIPWLSHDYPMIIPWLSHIPWNILKPIFPFRVDDLNESKYHKLLNILRIFLAMSHPAIVIFHFF